MPDNEGPGSTHASTGRPDPGDVRPGWEELGGALIDAQEMTSDWAQTWTAVDRAQFLPDRIWPFDHVNGSTSRAITRTTDRELWLRAADSNCAIVTQRDDGTHTGHDARKVPTSSLPQPSVAMAMLRDLDVEPGMRVLEIGTGTGWTAGLLAHHLGEDYVVTMEVDEDVADDARRRLSQTGLRPTVLAVDGLAGDAPRSPCDRIITACGLREIPRGWIEQVRPGGIILAPWGTSSSSRDLLVKLTVADDGKSASGPFLRTVEEMRARGQQEQRLYHADFVSNPPSTTVRESSTDLGPDDLADVGFLFGLLVPDAEHTVIRHADGRADAWFYSRGADRSWASVTWGPDGEAGHVRQHGERELWTGTEMGFCWWDAMDRPSPSRFGLTVDTSGDHMIWIDGPEHAAPRQA